MPRALFLSPHLDDVAFSCGGTFHALATRGWTTTLCTVFTRSVANPTGFALACQLDKGLAADVDYLALRRAEDERAAAALGASAVRHFDLPEAPHRGYEGAAELFGEFASLDTIAPAVVACVAAELGEYDLVFAPQALGSHVDHRRVRDAVRALAATRAIEDRVIWYRDAPYVLREPDAVPERELAAATPHAFGSPLTASALEAKCAASAAYATQLRFQFAGEEGMRAALAAFARAEAMRFDLQPTTFGEGFRTRSSDAIELLGGSGR